MDTPEVWRQIRDRDGSVQDLDFLSENEKEVFKTYAEIDQCQLFIKLPIDKITLIKDNHLISLFIPTHLLKTLTRFT